MATILSFAALTGAQSLIAEETWVELTLKSAGYEPTLDGAASYLKGLQSNEEARKRTQSLLRELGADNYAAREAAMEQLAAFPQVDLVLLRQQVASEDAEIRWRVRKILAKREFRDSALLSAALTKLEQDGDRQFYELAWNAAPLASDRICLGNLTRFLSSAYKGEVEVLERRSRADDPLTRVVAIETIRLICTPSDAAEKVGPLINDADPRVVLSVARVLADVGDRRSLKALVDVTGSGNADAASAAVWTLESITGQTVPSELVAEQDPAAVAQFWSKWCDENGATASLAFPVGRGFTARGGLGGGMLYSTGSAGKIVQLDRSGAKIWEYDMPAWSAEKLRSGNVLIASFDKAEVREVRMDNSVVWRWARPGSRPIRAKPLPNGNVLVADYDGRRVVELGEGQREVWEASLGNENCFDAERLENGNTLVATPSSLIEFRPSGERVRTWPMAGRINSLQVLPSGNFLVANHGLSAVMEINRQGDILWEYAEQGASEAFQTEDGHYLITSDRRCIELSPDRTRVRVLHPAMYGSARR